MKKHLKNSWFRRAAALLLSLTTTASVVAAAVPAPTEYAAVSAEEIFDSISAEELFDSISVSTEPVTENSISASGTVHEPVYASAGSAPVTELDEVTKKKIEDMAFYVDFGPNHYVASRKLANKTKYYPERNEAWGYKVGGCTNNDNWFYRSIRWMSYFKKGDTINPLFPYNETEDRVDSYWSGSWKKYPKEERTDVGSTCYLGDADAWHKITVVSGENRILIENKHTYEGIDSSNGSTYCCGVTTVPIKSYFEVPAKTSYRVTVKFSFSANCCGESSLALVDSFPSMQDTDISPNGESWVVNSDYVTLKYNEFADVMKESAGRLGIDMIPTTSNSDFQNEANVASQTTYYDYTFTNNTDSPQIFMRCFYMVLTQAMDYQHEAHNGNYSYYDGQVSMSVVDLHYDTGTTELGKEDNTQAEDTDTSERLSVSIGEVSNTADGSSVDYGFFGVTQDASGRLNQLTKGYYGSGNTGKISECYSGISGFNSPNSSKLGTVSVTNNTVTVDCHTLIGSSQYVPYLQACIPVKLSYRVPANTRTTITYSMDMDLLWPTNGEWVIGILDGAANSSLTETTPTAEGLNGSVPTYYASDAVISINGQGSTNSLGFTSYYLDDACTYDGEAVTLDYMKSHASIRQKLFEAIADASLSKGDTTKNASAVSFDKSVTMVFNNLGGDTETVFERYFVIYAIHQINPYGTTKFMDLKNLEFSFSFTHSETNVRTLKMEEGISKYYLEWENDTTMFVLNDIKGEESDKDPSTAQGWYRLVMSVPSSTQSYGGVTMNYSGGLTFTGQVSENGYTNVQPYYTHPLGYYLRYAWLYNGVDSEPGADGYDLARPLLYLGPQALPASYTTNSTTGAAYIPTQPVEGTLTRDDYQAWYIKAADDYGGFYLAMEGTDGKRHLLCHNVTCEGNTAVEHTTCFVTAAEYEAYPELYQTAYAWPITYNAATSLSADNVGLHKYKGFWQKTADSSSGSIITEENLKDEAFRFPVKNNLMWHCVNNSDGSFYGFYSMIEVQDITDPDFKNEDYSLYTYYQTYKDKTGTVDQQILSEYATEIQHCLSIFKESPTICVGAESYTYDSKQYVRFCQVHDKNDLIRLNVSLGTYTDDTPEKQITVGNGQVYKVTGTSKIASGQTMVIEKGGTLQITGTLVNEGTLLCYGTVQIENYGCLRDAAGSVSGEYCYVGGTLVIATNGVFRQTIAATGNGYNRFYLGSTIYNDGLLISPSGLALDASTLDNGTNGVVMTACTLRASSDLYTPRELALTFPRGMPDGETQYKLVTQLMRTYIDQNYKRFSTDPPQNHRNKLYMTNHSVVRNNGVMYCTGGIYLESGTDTGANVLIGKNDIIMYTPLVNGSFKNYKGETVKFAHTDMARYGFYVNNEPMNNNISEENWQSTWILTTTDLGEESNYVMFGCQSVEEALEGSTMSTSDWNSYYNDASKYKIESGGGC